MAEESFDIYDDINYNQTGEDDFSLYDDISNAKSATTDTSKSSNLTDSVAESSSSKGSEHQTGVYIGNLTWWTTDQDLENIFSEFGKIKNLRFFEEKVNGKSKGFAVVEFFNPETAQTARDKVNNREIHGKPCVVNLLTQEDIKQLLKANTSTIKKEKDNKPKTGGASGGGRYPKGPGGIPAGMAGIPMVPGVLPGPYPPRGGRGFPMIPVADPRLITPHYNPAFFNQWGGNSDRRHSPERDYDRDRDRDRDRYDDRKRERDRDHDRDRHRSDERKRHKDRKH